MSIETEAHRCAQDLLDFIDSSPSPWHAGASIENVLVEHGFQGLKEDEHWPIESGARYYVVRGDSSVIAFITGKTALDHARFHLVGAHTDSPGLRLKPRSPHAAESLARLGVEIYGGPILATFADRDLSLAGRVNFRRDKGLATSLIRIDEPLLRLPNLPIHMNRGVNEEGLKFNKQTELPLLFANLIASQSPADLFLGLISEKLGVDRSEIINWELHVYDTQKGGFWGAGREFIADSQLDNLASCHAALSALTAIDNPEHTALCGFFDHEEVGSESAKGADGSFLGDVTERIAHALGLDHEGYRRALSRSFFISADMAHAYHPNFPGAYEPNHLIQVNGGPVIKTNVNQRYATDSVSEAYFIELCDSVNVVYQQYAHRTDLACGSTIGPMIAARLGIPSVDVGNPMWAMHSCRESAGVRDHANLIKVIRAFFLDPK